MIVKNQFAFVDSCAGNRRQIAARARVKAVKVTPKLWIVRMEEAIVTQPIGISSKLGTDYRCAVVWRVCVWNQLK